MKRVHAEIEYVRADGMRIHSDICPPDCSSKGLKDEKYRAFLHKCLDEWLDKSDGSLGFYIKDEDYKFEY